MVLPPGVASIVAAAVVALISSASLIALRHKKMSQDEAVLFSITPLQREALVSSTFTTTYSNLTQDIQSAYDKQGYVIIRGLLEDTMLDHLDTAAKVFLEATKRAPSTFSALKFGPVFLSPPRSNETNNDAQELTAFRQASLESAIPSFVATVLLNLDPENQSLRVLKDVFLAKGKEQEYCGWHVDDLSFWPTSPRIEPPGANVWIAMDDISSEYGGGLAVSPASHKASWRQEAYETIGSTQVYPKGGCESVAQAFTMGKTTTCNLANVAPKLAARIDRTRHVFDFKKGDVLIHTRWLFHRSMPLSEKGVNHFEGIQQEPLIKRYSIRYEVGHSQLMDGISFEPCVLLNEENRGKSLDYVCSNDATPWYPKCWPQVDPEEQSHLYEVVDDKLPRFEPLKQELFREALPYLKKS